MSKIEWSIKKRVGTNDWQKIKLADMSGRTLENVMFAYTGQEVVAEFIINGKKHYFCGTEKWKQQMKSKGNSVSFAEAIDLLRVVNPGLLAMVCPGEDIEGMFPGCTVESGTAEQPAIGKESA